jgi:potassium-dependent mechanosensitive channel
MAAKRINAFVYTTLLVCLQLLSTGLNAQEQTATKDSATIEQPAAITLVELGVATEKVRENVNLARNRMARESSIVQIDSLFRLFSENLDRDREDYLFFRKVTPNRQKLDNMIYKWSSYSDRLTGWQRSLNRYQTRNSLSLSSLEFDSKSWNLTATAVESMDIPGTVKQSIEKSIIELNGVINELKEQNNRILTVETKIVEQKDEIDRLLKDLEEWIQSGELNMFYRRHEPIWQTSFARTDEERARIGENSFLEKVEVIPDYFVSYQHDLNVYALWVILLFAFIFYLRKRLRAFDVPDGNRRVQRMKEIITNNVFATSSFLILLAIAIFLNNLPQTLAEMFAIGLLISAMILLRPFTYPEFKWLIIFIVIAFVLEALKSYFWFSSSNYRIYMFAQSLFALAVIGHNVMLKSKVKELGMGPIGRTMYRLIPLLIAIQVLAIVSNILGYTNLSDLLLKVGTMSAVITVIIYGILIVVGGILAASITLYFENKTNYNVAYPEYLQKRAQLAVSVLAVILWIFFFLLSADLYRPLAASLELWLSEPWTFGKMSITPGNLLYFFVILIVTFAITRFISTIVQEGVMRPLKLSRGVPSAISLVIRYFIIVFGVVVSLGALGVDLSGFSLMAGALGVGIGFGLQNIISNFVAGIILTFERPILPEDTVEVGTILGVVKKIGVRSSIVRSFDGADVVVPNNNLLSNELINWTQADHKKRVEIKIGAAYGTNPNVVMKILYDAAMEYKYTHKNPEPLPLFDEFADSSLNFRLLFWVPVDSVLVSKSDVSIDIYNRFEAAGIQIPFPQQDVNIIQKEQNTESDT